MICCRFGPTLAVAPLIAWTALAPVERGPAEQSPQGPPRTGILMMVPGNPEGSVVYAKPHDVVFRAALQVAAAQGDVTASNAESGTLEATLGRPGPPGSQLTMSVTLSKLADDRIQVVATPAGADYPSAATATRVYVAALTTAVAGKPVRVRASVFTDETQPARLRNRRESVKDLAGEIGSSSLEIVPATAKGTAKLWLEVLRTGDSEGLTVRLTVPGTDYSTEWTRSSPTDSGAAEEVAKVFKAWLTANRDFLLTQQGTRPAPPGRCSVPDSAAAPPVTGPGPERIRLYLGPAPAAHGFVNVDPAFAAGYADLCAAYKRTPSFSSALVLVSNREAADLVLELTYRGQPMFSHNALEELRAVVFVAGPGTRVELNGRTGIVKQGNSNESSWPMQATRLLQQTVDWIGANREVIERARAQHPAKPPDR